jgi:hypothetical protein
MNILENELVVTEQNILLAGIDLASAQKALRSTNPYNKVAVAEARNNVDAASAKLGQAYDRLIAIRFALIAEKAGA